MSRPADDPTTPNGTLTLADPEILAILDEYLATIEQGKPADFDALLAGRPELADELKAYFDSINFLHLASRELTDLGDTTSLSEDWSGRRLGDYEVIRELGRGGMGVVYEAQQTKLGRRVALKVLPLTAVLDKRQTARFLIEAQAAAQLSHPNIVPVYDVGCERGVHYYSMRYIEGQTLEMAIQELHRFQIAGMGRDADPPSATARDTRPLETRDGFSTCCSTRDRNYISAVARLGIQAAEALQHAHDYGIVHRDIKPSNLMIDCDGNLWVADFGLARCQADSAITLTGAVLGTARYMSPEQAAGRRGMVDHRTDIYSLGGTLYELLTLRTAYHADSISELLRQIESREPAAPRRLNPSIPFDLETIVLKAISKHRSHRYATAEELANDLRRFVAGEPIAARRPSLLERTAKWANRHKNLVATASAVTLLALLGTSVAVVLIAREKSATEAALTASKDNLERSQNYFRQSREVLDHFGLLVVDRLTGVPGTERLRNQVLLDTLQYYQRFIAQAGEDPTLQADLAITCFKSGEILDRLGSRDKALASYQRALGIFERLDSVDAVAHVAASHNNIALLLAAQGNVASAKSAFGQAIRLYEGRLATDAANAEFRLQLASACGNLAQLLANTDQRNESLKYHRRALDLQRELVHEHPERSDFRRELAMTCNNLSFFHQVSDPVRSVEFNQQAIDLLRRITSAEPDNLECQSDLALSFTNQGSLLAGKGDYQRAEVAFREAIELYVSLLRQAPHVFAYRRDLAVAHNNLGRTLTEIGQSSDARVALEDARDTLKSLASDSQGDLVVMSSLGGVLNNLGLAYEQTGDYNAAMGAYEEAIALQRSALARAPTVTTFADFLNRTLENYARAMNVAGRSKDPAEADTPDGIQSKP